MKYEAVIVGCGFAGAVTARKLAEEQGKRVLVVEMRPHIGGNMHDGTDAAGVLVHHYGPHIFHTNHEDVLRYLERFSSFHPYEHRVLGKIDGRLVPIPFNFRSIDLLFPEDEARKIKEKLAGNFPEMKTISVIELLHHVDPEIAGFGKFVFEKVFVNYTAKQWGIPPELVDSAVLNRVPVVLGYDDRYFTDKYQCMPEEGYAPLFRRMLDHENITVRLCCDADESIGFDEDRRRIFFEGSELRVPLVYTGAIDRFMKYKFGPLPYRSLDLVFENLPVDRFQPAAVVNYPNEEAFTRITEFKYLTGQQKHDSTTIMKEYPLAYDKDAQKGNLPYYPIVGSGSLLYEKYKREADLYPDIHLCGRLAQYQYFNMDQVIKQAFAVVDKIEF